jgi:hypothetical protein
MAAVEGIKAEQRTNHQRWCSRVRRTQMPSCLRDGVHVADSDTITVAEAGKLWLKTGAGEGLERSTIDQREQHLRLHIVPFIGGES